MNTGADQDKSRGHFLELTRDAIQDETRHLSGENLVANTRPPSEKRLWIERIRVELWLAVVTTVAASLAAYAKEFLAAKLQVSIDVFIPYLISIALLMLLIALVIKFLKARRAYEQEIALLRQTSLPTTLTRTRALYNNLTAMFRTRPFLANVYFQVFLRSFTSHLDWIPHHSRNPELPDLSRKLTVPPRRGGLFVAEFWRCLIPKYSELSSTTQIFAVHSYPASYWSTGHGTSLIEAFEVIDTFPEHIHIFLTRSADRTHMTNVMKRVLSAIPEQGTAYMLELPETDPFPDCSFVLVAQFTRSSDGRKYPTVAKGDSHQSCLLECYLLPPNEDGLPLAEIRIYDTTLGLAGEAADQVPKRIGQWNTLYSLCNTLPPLRELPDLDRLPSGSTTT